MDESTGTLRGERQEATCEQIHFRIPYGESFKCLCSHLTSSRSLKFSDYILVR